MRPPKPLIFPRLDAPATTAAEPPPEAHRRAFYRWKLQDFCSFPASELQHGDAMAYGTQGNGRYGAVPITVEERVEGERLRISFILPAGAIAESGPTRKIQVAWSGEHHVITVYEELDYFQLVLVHPTKG